MKTYQIDNDGELADIIENVMLDMHNKALARGIMFPSKRLIAEEIANLFVPIKALAANLFVPVSSLPDQPVSSLPHQPEKRKNK